MYCPSCGAEYRVGYTECSDCGVPLVAERAPAPEPEAPQDVQLERVFESTNPALLAMAKSLLDAAGIDYVTSGEGSQYGSIPVRIAVPKERISEAVELLGDLDAELAPEGEDGEDETALED